MRSFSRKGTPRKGPSGSAREAASARAFSKRGMMTAFSSGLVRSMRAIAASTSSAGLAVPRRTSSACALASSQARSSLMRGTYDIPRSAYKKLVDAQQPLPVGGPVQDPRSCGDVPREARTRASGWLVGALAIRVPEATGPGRRRVLGAQVETSRPIAEARRHLHPGLRAGRARRRENARYEERRTDQPSLTHHRPVPYADRRLPSTVPRRKHDGGRIRDPSPVECNRSDRTYEQIRFALPAAGALDQVQLTVALGWLVVTVKLVAVPTVLQTTPPEPVKPGSALHAPVAYVLVSTNAASWAVAALRASAATRALKPRERYAENCGIAIAARMPMIATTTSSSINVKPLDFFRFILETLLILSPLAGWVLVCLDTCRDALAVVGSPRSKRGATGEKAQRSKGDGAKGHRFAVGMDGATSRLCVRACPAIGAKLTGGTIPSPAERKAHVGRHPQGSRRGGSGGAPAGDAGRPGTAGRGP